jgi:hypothetical protein
MLRLVGWHDQDEIIAEQVLACVGNDQLPVGQVVHPFLVGRGKEVGGCALLDLARQC